MAGRVGRRARRREHHRHIQTAARRRKPRPSAPAAAGRLRVGDDDGPSCRAVGRQGRCDIVGRADGREKKHAEASGPSRGRARSIASARSGGQPRQRFDFEADVDGRRRMRQRADRHVVGAGRGELRQPLERHPARDLHFRAALAHAGRFRGSRSSDRLSARMMSAPAASASSTSSRLCASISTVRSGRCLRGTRHGRFDASGEPYVVVLDQDARRTGRSDGSCRRPRRRRTSRARGASASSCACRAR